jgi:hypothetical protein
MGAPIPRTQYRYEGSTFILTTSQELIADVQQDPANTKRKKVPTPYPYRSAVEPITIR